MLGKMLDQRAVSIKTELDEARALREEAQTILASYERKQKEVSEQAARIVEDAKNEAKEAAEQAKIDLEKSVQRRLSADEEKGIVLETKRREKIGKKKQVVVKQHKLAFKQIDQTKIVISF